MSLLQKKYELVHTPVVQDREAAWKYVLARCVFTHARTQTNNIAKRGSHHCTSSATCLLCTMCARVQFV